MDPLQRKLIDVIESRLREGKADLEMLPGGRIAGHVVSTEFDEMDYEERRKRLWEIIDEELSKDEISRVSTLLTYTPEEWNVTL